jgi:hypothetical protein
MFRNETARWLTPSVCEMHGGDRFGFATRLSSGGLALRLLLFTRFGGEFALRKLMVPFWHQSGQDAIADFPGVAGLQAERLPDFKDGGGDIPALLRLDDRVEQLPPVSSGGNNRGAQPAIKAARFQELTS